MLTIRPAVLADLPAICSLYGDIIDFCQTLTERPGWQREIYPTEGYFREAILADTMYVGELDGALAAGMVVNQKFSDGYRGAPWSVRAEDSQVAAIHTLGVHPRLLRSGVGQQMARGALELARERGWLAVRLDVLSKNPAAARMYEKVGFRYVSTVNMFYEDTGWADFLLYEYGLEKTVDNGEKPDIIPM